MVFLQYEIKMKHYYYYFNFHFIQGPWEWADALYLESDGEKIVVQETE